MENFLTPNNEKLVSIGLVVYNGANRVRRALDSLLAQTYRNFELIISDDASADETQAICEEYALKDKRIRYIRQERNLGRRENYRFVVREARGEYFMWAADDDWRDPRWLEILVDALERNKGYDLAMGSVRRIYYPENIVKDKLILTTDQSTTNQSYAEVFKRLVNDELVHLFANGLWRKDFFAKLLSRPMPDTVKWDRTLMAEAALATHFYSVEPVLYVKTQQKISIGARHKGDPEQKLHFVPFAFSRYLFTMFYYLITSPVIPLKRKLLSAIWLWPSFFWRSRKRIFWVAVRDCKDIAGNTLREII